MTQTLDPIQHILDKLSMEDCEDLIDFFNDLHTNINLAAEQDSAKIDTIIRVQKWIDSLGTEGNHIKNHMDKVGTVDVFDDIYPIKEAKQIDKDIEDLFDYTPVPRPGVE